MIVLYDSYNKHNVELKVINNQVKIYVCGPTVYNFIHLGNLRPTLTFDLLKRNLLAQDIEVFHICNITDIDDKIIDQAKLEKTSEEVITAKYFDQYIQDLKDMKIIMPKEMPKVTDNMEAIIDLIAQLLDKGFAYEIEGDGIYFDISKSPKYGYLYNLQGDKLKLNASKRINQKKDHNDFALWKFKTKGKTFSSPWGQGRPGWHSECVALIYKLNPNQQVDIHGGGIDLKFPHHTNEIAHHEALHDFPLAKIWMHNGFVNFGKEKMSKSLGNVLLVKDEIKKHDPNIIKLVFLSTHYQKPLKYNEAEVKQQSKVWKKIINYLTIAQDISSTLKKVKGKYSQLIIEQLNNNLNSPNALSVLFKALKDFNTKHRAKLKVNTLCYDINYCLWILGLNNG